MNTYKNPMIKIDLSRLNTKISKPGLSPLVVTDPTKIKAMLKHLDRIIVLKPEPIPTPPIVSEIQEEIKVEDIKEEVEDVEESEVEYLDQFESVNENSSIDENASQCDSCDEKFSESSSLIIHKTEQSIKRTRAILRKPLVKCNGNVQMPDNNFDSNTHTVQYENRDPIPRRRRYLKSKQTDDQPVSCPKCDRIFKRMKYLKVHMVTVHGKQIRCQVCERRFDTLVLLKIHMEDVHRGYFTEFCSICSKGFRLSQALKTHLAAHARDDNLCVCEVCGRAFRHEVYLRKHVQTIHVELHGEKKYQCDYCDYATHHKSRFTEHMCKHTGKGLVQCQFCLKYVRKGTLKIHTRIHTGEKPEICEYCGRSFSARKYLTKHLVTHTGEKPYQCQICGKSYTQRGTLTLHFRRHHADDTEIPEQSTANDRTAEEDDRTGGNTEDDGVGGNTEDDGTAGNTEDDGADGITEDDGIDGITEDDGIHEKDEGFILEDDDLDMDDEEYVEFEEGKQNLMETEMLEEEGVVTYDNVELFQEGMVSEDGVIEENVIEELIE